MRAESQTTKRIQINLIYNVPKAFQAEPEAIEVFLDEIGRGNLIDKCNLEHPVIVVVGFEVTFSEDGGRIVPSIAFRRVVHAVEKLLVAERLLFAVISPARCHSLRRHQIPY